MGNLRQELLIESSSVNMEFLKSKTREITAGEYVPSIAEIVNSVSQIGTGAVLIVNNYISGLILGTDSGDSLIHLVKMRLEIYQVPGTRVFIKFDTFHSFENYI